MEQRSRRREDTRERVRRFRAAQKEAKPSNALLTQRVTQCNAPTVPNPTVPNQDQTATPVVSDDFALQLPSSTPKTKRSTPPDTTLVADFETWWQKYPRKVDKKKALALYLWQRKQHTAEATLTALRHYVAACEESGQYFMYPATFLSKQSSYIEDYQTPPEPPRPRERQTDYYDDGMDIHV